MQVAEYIQLNMVGILEQLYFQFVFCSVDGLSGFLIHQYCYRLRSETNIKI